MYKVSKMKRWLKLNEKLIFIKKTNSLSLLIYFRQNSGLFSSQFLKRCHDAFETTVGPTTLMRQTFVPRRSLDNLGTTSWLQSRYRFLENKNKSFGAFEWTFKLQLERDDLSNDSKHVRNRTQYIWFKLAYRAKFYD